MKKSYRLNWAQRQTVINQEPLKKKKINKLDIKNRINQCKLKGGKEYVHVMLTCKVCTYIVYT